MSVCAVTAEYNPFHNGHKYQIDLLKKKFDTVIVIMSGNFTERGDVAIIDKQSRAKIAVLCGADLVIELPTVFAMSTAERFAFGSISIMNSLGNIDCVSFGSESGDIEKLTEAAGLLSHETEDISRKIVEYQKQGISYAKSREMAYSGMVGSDILSKPNNILAVEYIKQLILSKSEIKPITHLRVGDDYNSDSAKSNFASAKSIRNIYDDDKVKDLMPEEAYSIFKEESKHFLAALDDVVLFHIRKNPNSLKSVLECTNGIENRIIKAAMTATSINEIIDLSVSKTATRAKIRRIILSSLLGITKEHCHTAPTYARVLAASKNGCAYLSKVKETAKLEIITKISDYKNPLLDIDILASDIYSLSSQNKNFGSDYKKSPFIK